MTSSPIPGPAGPPPVTGLGGRRILLVEDEIRLARLLRTALGRAGAVVDLCHDGREGLARAVAGSYDVVVLDLGLPHLSGNRILAGLRDCGSHVPVLVLTARTAEKDELGALELGADDYVTKPFSTPVLIVRLARLVQRRSPAPALGNGHIRLEPTRHRAWVADEELTLTAREYAVLEYLVCLADQTVSKQELLDEVWNEPYADPNVVEVCVAALRRKVGRGVIETVRHVGYRVAPKPL